MNVRYAFPAIFGPLKPLTLRMDHRLLDVLMSLSVNNAIYYLVPVQIDLVPSVLQRHVRPTMRHVVLSAAVDRHMSKSDDVYL